MSSFLTKHIISGVITPILFVICLVTTAQATSFNWRYEFADMTVVSGMLEGDINPVDMNTVNVTSIMVEYSEDPSATFDLFIPNNQFVSLDGSNMDIQVNGQSIAFFQIFSTANIAQVNGSGGFPRSVDIPYAPERWSITEKVPIPDTMSLMLILGTGMLGLLAWARRRDKRWATT